jgi:glycine/D-amino acid oxidase-like deaminating enzyme
MFGDLIPLPLDNITRNDNDVDDDDDDSTFYLPVHLVRGQSIEMDLPTSLFSPDNNSDCEQQQQQQPALLCGKYVSPLPPSRNGRARLLIGATHEFKINNPMSPEQVVSFLQDATAPMIPSTFWHQQQYDDDDDNNVHGSVGAGRLKITSGFRVQSQRGKFGRMPIIGRYPYPLFNAVMQEQDRGTDASQMSTSSQNKYTSWCRQDQDLWIFTGLSSRGLLYHALYGDLLTDAILANDEQVLWTKSPDLKWWWQKKKKNK